MSAVTSTAKRFDRNIYVRNTVKRDVINQADYGQIVQIYLGASEEELRNSFD